MVQVQQTPPESDDLGVRPVSQEFTTQKVDALFDSMPREAEAPQEPSVQRATLASETFVGIDPSKPPPQPQVQRYIVVGIALNDTLNVRSGPGATNALIAQLPPGYRDITVEGGPVCNGETEWVLINFGEYRGWVAGQFLHPQN